jgi:hypothetical protein
MARPHVADGCTIGRTDRQSDGQTTIILATHICESNKENARAKCIPSYLLIITKAFLTMYVYHFSLGYIDEHKYTKGYL